MTYFVITKRRKKGQGLSGIELEYDDMLTGENGAIKYYSDAKGNRLNLSDIYEAPSNGMNIQLTIVESGAVTL